MRWLAATAALTLAGCAQPALMTSMTVMLGGFARRVRTRRRPYAEAAWLRRLRQEDGADLTELWRRELLAKNVLFCQ
jgi:hypothetical protein